MKFVLATNNLGKIKEMREILPGLGIEFLTRADVGIDVEIEETGTTFKENALLKANAICALSGLPAIADDSGLMVDALGGAPGVYTSTFGGEGLSSAERCGYLLKKLSGVRDRNAKFVCMIVCVFPDGGVITAQGECVGEIADEPRGWRGFGYDPVFIANGYSKTMAELSPEEKNAISHRGAALRSFSILLKKRGMNGLIS
ncbi:MAG: RdgB/HAM1 family non-canonical purine NTP pyrophosphatase [Oscillospiraceae bacterium]|nr:RdgB/HAM1 family non-canonical purine NTP pyrophosphatase [Oscillospiraceae bacterium]MCL2151564.1 RdgB/HAM1 family non-canonical purine NTP pyrophosphatase [Oscillospiraceae bacterium]